MAEGNGGRDLTDTDEDLTPLPSRIRNPDMVREVANLRMNVDQRLGRLCAMLGEAPEPFPREMLGDVVDGLRGVRDEFNATASALEASGGRGG